MYHWNRFKKLILGHGRGASLLASPRHEYGFLARALESALCCRS